MADITPIAGVILRDDTGRYLLVQQAKKHIYGLWNWPAGHVDPGESLDGAAIREAKEETGLDVEIIDAEPLHEASGDPGTNHHTYLFVAKVTGGTLRFQDGELLDARWFSRSEVEGLHRQHKTRGDWVLTGINKLENRLSL